MNHETPDDLSDDDLIRLWAGVNEIAGEIEDTSARTLAGLAAKTRVFVADAAGCVIQPDDGLLASVLKDIATLTGEAAHG